MGDGRKPDEADSVGARPEDRPVEMGDLELIYKLEGARNDIPIFELSRMLEAV